MYVLKIMNKSIFLQSDIKIMEVEPHFIETKCRTPLKFGSVVVEELAYCQTRVRVCNGKGEVADGWGGIFLMDNWCFPTSRISHELKDQAMKKLVKRFANLYESYKNYDHPVDIFMELEQYFDIIKKDVCKELGLIEEMPYLGALVCASSIDAAVHDAFGMVNNISTYNGYGRSFMRFDLSRYLGPSFNGRYIESYIRPEYKPVIPVFHLVGGLDKLRKNEIDEGDPKDGLPNTLDEWIKKDGLFCLKVKLNGRDLEWDIDRMLEVVSIAHEAQEETGKSALYFSADTNEQCEHPDYIVEMLLKLKERSQTAYQELLYVEQPTERDLQAHRYNMREVAGLKPVIIDESLTTLEDFDLAMELGWSGIALKTCKCQSSALLFAAKADDSRIPYTVQDLTNPGISLIQSVGLASRINTFMGVEANSAQFFPKASEPEANVHPGVYFRNKGMLSTSSLKGYGLGYQMEKIDRVF